MTSKQFRPVHSLPKDLSLALKSDQQAWLIWQTLTPLAQNEWICWTISVKQAKTRRQHINRLVNDLKHGKRRPCCWIGCIHRLDKQLSPSVKWAIGQK
jgi:uncharacterized protein YdeI (YjbR/CyaY-like superfamily)